MLGLIRTIRNGKRNRDAFKAHGKSVSDAERSRSLVRVVYHDVARDEDRLTATIRYGKVTYTGPVMFGLTDDNGTERFVLYRNLVRFSVEPYGA